MSAAAALGAVRPAAGAEPRWVIADHVARSALRWALVWGAVFGLFVIATIKAFVTAYPTLRERQQIAGALQSFSMLLGPPRHAETVAGFTSWRVLVVIVLIGAIWGLLTSTGLLRGEEDAGRWEILLAGRTTKRRATAQALVGLGLALAAMFALTALLVVAAGRQPAAHFSLGASLLFAAALVSGAAMFLAVGSLASQLSATRSQAATVGAAVLGASFLIRMVADSKSDLAWLRWLSPIGWAEELRPLRDTQPVALVPIVALVAICAGLTIHLAGRRDLGASVLQEGEAGAGATGWLVGPTSLTIRLTRTTALTWIAGIALFGAMLGLVARSAATLLNSSPAIVATLGRLGVRKASEGYLGAAFLFVAVLLAVLAASQVAAARDEEGAGRLDNLLVRPVRRLAWLGGRIALALALVLLAALAAGAATWASAAREHIGVALPVLLEAGLNASVPAIVVLGVGVLVLGLRPRFTSVAVYGLVAWSFLIDLLGAFMKGGEWLRNTSLFTHIALAPSAKPDWGAAAVMIALAVGAALVGALAFQRRDLEAA